MDISAQQDTRVLLFNHRLIDEFQTGPKVISLIWHHDGGQCGGDVSVRRL